MLVKVIRDFAFSRDGFRTELAKAGSEVDIPDRLVAGLTAEGFLAQEPESATKPAGQRAVKPRRKR